ncbi:MAG: hypothetical protein QXM75_01940 [Candidatus Diapherotrites archaeon]
MKKKGFLESVDVMLSTILLMFAVGYAYRVSEGNYYSIKQDELYDELRIVGNNAAEILVSAPEITCQCSVLAGTSTGRALYIMNCLDISKISVMSADDLKRTLKIPNERFGASLKLQAGTTTLGPYGDNMPSEVKDYYSERRIVIANAGNITKEKLLKCMQGRETCDKYVATITVWRT